LKCLAEAGHECDNGIAASGMIDLQDLC